MNGSMKELMDKIFAEGRKCGFSDMEVFVSEGDSFEVKIYEQEIDSYKVADSKGMGFRGVFNGKMGYSYTEKIADDSIALLLSGARQNAELADSKEQDEIFAGSKEYKKVISYYPKLDDVTVEEKIEFARRMERTAKAFDKRIKSCPYCLFGSNTGAGRIYNTKGLDLDAKSNSLFCYVEALAQDGDDFSDGLAICDENDFAAFDPDKLAKEAAVKALSYLGTKPIKTGQYKVIMENIAVSDILSAVSSCFSARSVQKGVSFLKGRLGTEVASACVTLVDDPFKDGQGGTASFDGEGIATKYKEVISKGILKTYLHNSKSAKKDGVESTGNASRSYKSNISIAPTNLYIIPGTRTLDELEKVMGDGIVISEVAALHSGFDAISGDFSLPAKGHVVKNGNKAEYFRQITISGNFFSLIKNITEVGSDLSFGTNRSIGSPSLLISNISVAGE
jgi:PmbA protein